MKKLPLIAITFFIFLFNYQSFAADSADQCKKDYVTLLHGLNRDYQDMQRIELALVDQGFEVINIDYPSTEISIEEIAGQVKEIIKEENKNKNCRMNFVTFSMGGVVLRKIFTTYKPKNLGRVVMIAPPNKGTEVSDFLRDNFLSPIFDMIYGPSGKQVGVENEDSIINELPKKANYKLGIIAGKTNFSLFFSNFILPGKDDGVVSVESTKLEGMSDFIIINSIHYLMPRNEEVIAQVVNFLEKGKFSHAREISTKNNQS